MTMLKKLAPVRMVKCRVEHFAFSEMLVFRITFRILKIPLEYIERFVAKSL